MDAFCRVTSALLAGLDIAAVNTAVASGFESLRVNGPDGAAPEL